MASRSRRDPFGTIRPKAFTTVRLAKSYFDDYSEKKLKDNYEVVVEDNI